MGVRGKSKAHVAAVVAADAPVVVSGVGVGADGVDPGNGVEGRRRGRGGAAGRVPDYKRVTGRYTALGYETSATLVRDGLVAQVGRSDGLSEFQDRRRLVAQSRSLLERCEIYEGLVGRTEAYTVGGGFALSVLLPDRALAARVEAAWKAWSEDALQCDVRGVLDFAGMQSLVFREHVVAGDSVAVLVREANGAGQVQVLESEQLYSREHPSGIQVNALGRPVKFHLCGYKNGRIDDGSARGYDPEQVIFLTDPKRPSQLRTKPLLQSAFPTLLRVSDVCDSEAMARQIQAKLALSITKKDGEASGYLNSVVDPDADANRGDLALRVTEMDNALIFYGNPGDEVKTVERSAPGADFEQEMRMFMRLIGLPLGLPLELILLDWSEANYSQSRAVLEQAFQQFRRFQKLLSSRYCSRVFTWKLNEWVSTGALPGAALAAATSHSWIMPSFPWIDQLKETEAQGEKVLRGFTTHKEVLRSTGKDRDEFLVEREAEVMDAIKIAERVKAATGQEVSWKLFAGLSEGKTEAAAQVGQVGQEPGKKVGAKGGK